MDVFLVPLGAGRHELYCETPHETVPLKPGETAGFRRRWADRFTAMLAAIERERERLEKRGGPPGDAGWAGRMRGRAVRWMAEKVAEQRLLWRLRGEHNVRAFYSSDLAGDRAMEIIRGALKTDWERHRWWLVWDSLGGLLSLALVPFPGPNVIGLYFTFRIVGHLLALRGARHGLREVRWHLEPCDPLAQLSAAVALPSPDRERRVGEVAHMLGLARLQRFFERTAARPA
jgi:hypothetical protein